LAGTFPPEETGFPAAAGVGEVVEGSEDSAGSVEEGGISVFGDRGLEGVEVLPGEVASATVFSSSSGILVSSSVLRGGSAAGADLVGAVATFLAPCACLPPC